MKCPHCNKEVKVPPYAWYNAENYKNAVLVKTECCGNPIVIYPKTEFDVYIYDGDRTTDDWGLIFEKSKKLDNSRTKKKKR
jgi:hypothetical protein